LWLFVVQPFKRTPPKKITFQNLFDWTPFRARPSCPEFRNEYCVPRIRRSAGILPAILRPRRPRSDTSWNRTGRLVAGARASCPLSCGRDGRAPTARGTGLEDSSPERGHLARYPAAETAALRQVVEIGLEDSSPERGHLARYPAAETAALRQVVE